MGWIPMPGQPDYNPEDWEPQTPPSLIPEPYKPGDWGPNPFTPSAPRKPTRIPSPRRPLQPGYKPGDYLPPGRVPRTPGNPWGVPGWDNFDPTRYGSPGLGEGWVIHGANMAGGGGETAESNLPDRYPFNGRPWTRPIWYKPPSPTGPGGPRRPSTGETIDTDGDGIFTPQEFWDYDPSDREGETAGATWGGRGFGTSALNARMRGAQGAGGTINHLANRATRRAPVKKKAPTPTRKSGGGLKNIRLNAGRNAGTGRRPI